jgi:hypothetical protein
LANNSELRLSGSKMELWSQVAPRNALQFCLDICRQPWRAVLL